MLMTSDTRQGGMRLGSWRGLLPFPDVPRPTLPPVSASLHTREGWSQPL